MTDKVQKILEDVERLCNAGLHNSTISKKNVLNTILAVVNDFKEEPVSEDEKIRKAIKLMYSFLPNNPEYIGGVSIKKIFAWIEKRSETFTKKDVDDAYLKGICDTKQELEKRGEQKPVKNIVETWKDMRLEVYQQASGNRHDSNCSDDTTKMFSLNDIDEIIEKISEHKPTDKVEPKFHVRDWVVTDKGDTIQIGAVDTGYYTLYNGMNFSTSYIDKYWHLWTIADAKDGDVLVSGQLIILFKKFEEDTDWNFVIAHVGIDVSGKIQITNKHWLISNEAKPATKEQRERFFAALHDSGYEWDAEKKELKKLGGINQ